MTLSAIIIFVGTVLLGAVLFWCSHFVREIGGAILFWVLTVFISLVILYVAYLLRNSNVRGKRFFLNVIKVFFISLVLWFLAELILVRSRIVGPVDPIEIGAITVSWVPVLALWSASWFVFIRFAVFKRKNNPTVSSFIEPKQND